MKAIKLSIPYCVLIGSFFLTSCQGTPKKPTVSIGYIDYPRGEVIEVLTIPSPTPSRVPLAKYDRATCFKPKEWEKVQNYMDELETWLKSKLKE